MGNTGRLGRGIEALEPRRLLASVADADLLGPAQSVSASTADGNAAFVPANLLDGTTGAFRFGNGAAPQRLAVSNFNAAVHTLRFFDTPSYADRAATSVAVYFSLIRQLSLTPASYVPLGTFSLPADNVGGAAQGDVYRTPTSPAEHPRATDPLADPSATIHYAELTGLAIPPARRAFCSTSASTRPGSASVSLRSRPTGMRPPPARPTRRCSPGAATSRRRSTRR